MKKFTYADNRGTKVILGGDRLEILPTEITNSKGEYTKALIWTNDTVTAEVFIRFGEWIETEKDDVRSEAQVGQ